MNTMSAQRYFRELQAPFDWQLEPAEKEIAIELARAHGARVVIPAWHEYQKRSPLSTFAEFRDWFSASRETEEGHEAERIKRESSPLADFWRKTGKL